MNLLGCILHKSHRHNLKKGPKCKKLKIKSVIRVGISRHQMRILSCGDRSWRCFGWLGGPRRRPYAVARFGHTCCCWRWGCRGRCQQIAFGPISGQRYQCCLECWLAEMICSEFHHSRSPMTVRARFDVGISVLCLDSVEIPY